MSDIEIRLPGSNGIFAEVCGPQRLWPDGRFQDDFAAVADARPEAAAVIFDTHVLTYRQIETRANTLAHILVDLGVKREQSVGVLVERSGMLPLAFLAILKAGGAYVPMGGDLPDERLLDIARQSKMRCLIALDGLVPPSGLMDVLRKNGGSDRVLRPEEVAVCGTETRPETVGRPDDLAAILFTSGSTGRPKGVLLQHNALRNMAFGHIEAQQITAQDRILLSSSAGFILGLRELCVPLLAGAAIVPATRALLDEPDRLLAAMSRHRVSIAFFTPSYLRLLDGAIPEGLRCLMTAGERPNAADARHYAGKVSYWNVHGATEVCGTICSMPVSADGDGPIASGRPFANTCVFLLDEDGRDVPSGGIGEIYVCGAGLARGYLDQPELTAANFVQTRRGRAYRTHDLGRWLADGTLLTLGRADDAVKVSGQSVSLGEIEQTVLRHPAVRHAVAMQLAAKLIVFVEGGDDTPRQIEVWHAFLGRFLPSYMMPARVEVLAKMPTNASGKTDRKALRALAADGLQAVCAQAASQKPKGDVEMRIAAVWQEVLGVRTLGRTDNYFALGGTSLLAVAISQRLWRLGYVVPARTILSAPTIADLAPKVVQTIPTVSVGSFAPHQGLATKGQEDFWIAATLGFAAKGAQITRILSVHGHIPPIETWRDAWQRLVLRHAALRTVFFRHSDDTLRWRTVPTESLSSQFAFTDVECATAEAARRSIETQTAAVSLGEGPLARAGLIRVTQNGAETLFWFTLHHAIADGISARIVQTDMHALLSGRTLAQTLDGSAVASQAEQAYLASSAAENDAHYWQRTLDALVADPQAVFDELPTDRRRPIHPSGIGAPRLAVRLDAETVGTLTRLAQNQHASLHAVLMALLAAETRRRCGRSTVLLGTSVSVRPVGAEDTVGYFVNLPPVALHGDDAVSFAEQIRITQARLSETADHASYPSDLIYRAFRQRHPEARGQGRTSIFDISLTANPSRTCGNEHADLLLSPYTLPDEVCVPASGIDLAFSHEPLETAEDAGGLELALIWNPDVYRRETAQGWLSGFSGWARWLAEDLRRAEAPLPALLPAEVERLTQWQNGPCVKRPAKRVSEIFETIVDRHPDRMAVVADGASLTYAALESQANRIAQMLIRNGISHRDTVAVLTECSPSLPGAVLGVWKAGAIYLPLSVDLPPERLAFIAGNARTKVLMVLDGLAVPAILSQAATTVLRPECDMGDVPDTRAGRIGSPHDPAYTIYTSGTTGMPKGVTLPHDGVVNVALSTAEIAGLTETDRVALVSSPGFDASVWELGLALTNGFAMVPISSALRDDPWALKRRYADSGVTFAFHAPSYLRLSRATPFEGLRVLITGGEAPTHEDVRDHADRLDFWNAYGPTETTIIVSLEKMSAKTDEDELLGVGRPIANTVISIRRADGRLLPPGAIGEVWLGGVGVADGYNDNPNLSAERFVDTPTGRFYRTGDFGQWSQDGRLILHGRIDHQVKLHGQRIELGEIERALQSHPDIAEAVVLMSEAAQKTKALHAFIRLQPGAVMADDETWRAYLGTHLPAYMIPASIRVLDTLPLTAAGKVDRGALEKELRSRPIPRSTIETPPCEPLECRIAAAWQKLLGQTVMRESNFFALGGNSLLAVALAHRLSQDLARSISARDLFAAPTLAGFAARVGKRLQSMTHESLAAQSDLATEGQREFWVAQAAGLDTRTFNIPVIRRVAAKIYSPQQWHAAWDVLAGRHEGLRTAFFEDDHGNIRRVVASHERLTFGFDTATKSNRDAAFAYIRQCQQVPFHMASAPLWRVGTVDVLETGEQLFWLVLHHAVGDGQSVGILLEELSRLLQGKTLPPLTGVFSNAAAREISYLNGAESAADAAYWNDLLTRLPDGAFDEGALDFPRADLPEPGSHRFETQLDAHVAEALRTLARHHNTSLHAIMIALLSWEAHRRTGHAETIVGTAVSVRETAQDEGVVGYFVNMLPIPVRLSDTPSFGALIDFIRDRLSGALEHARHPFARIYQSLREARALPRHPARYPLFDMAVIENPPPADASAGELVRFASPTYEYRPVSPDEDMVLSHELCTDGTLTLQWYVNAAVYGRTTSQRWFSSLIGWARWLAEDILRADTPLPALLPAEAERLTQWENGLRVERPSLRFHELFEQKCDGLEAAGETHPAVSSQTTHQTYAALEAEANVLAHALMQAGVGRGGVVGVLTGRSAGLPAAALGVWKAGACYVPLSADVSAERLAFMAKDTGLAHLVVLDGLVVPDALAQTASFVLRPETIASDFRARHKHRPSLKGAPDDTAYIIYTSGTTGRPKGVRIAHRSYVNMVLSTGEAYALTPNDRCTMFSSPSFDVSLSDMGIPLAFGACICPLSDEIIASPQRFLTFLQAQKITLADITPSYLRLFDGAPLANIRILVTGGESPYPPDVRTYAARYRYFNAYGPTENTINSTMTQLSVDTPFLSAGRPLPNTEVHICTPDGRAVPLGASGEIWLGGAGLSLGYVARPDLTVAAFVRTLQGRRYRTGDLGRWRENGELEILGRIDDQVKLNGIRVELGEIETALLRHPDVVQAVAMLDHTDDRDHRLWAFVCMRNGASVATDEEWRAFLRDRLAAYMIPAAVIPVEAIPVSRSGKVDKAALKRRLVDRKPEHQDNPPHEGVESDLAAIWSETLGQASVRRDDNFFALGGHSLLAIAMAQKVEQRLGLSVSARELFAAPTLQDFAARIATRTPAANEISMPTTRATQGQNEFWVAEHAGLDTRGFVVPLTVRVRHTVDISEAHWRAGWAAMIERHEALRIGFRCDDDGVLRRFAAPPTTDTFEVCDADNLESALRHCRSRQSEPFAMGNPPLWRAGIVRVLETKQTLFWMALHHAIADGVSLGILTDDLAHALQGKALVPIDDSLERAAGRQNTYLAGPDSQADACYWQKTLRSSGSANPDDPQPFDEWPLDFLRPNGRTTQNAKGAHIFRATLAPSTVARLNAFAHKQGASLHALFMTLLALEIRRRTERSEFFLGTAASCRETAGEGRLVGYFVNMLPIACRIEDKASVEKILCILQGALADGMAHARYPFAQMYRDYRRDHGAFHPARYPLFDFAVAENPAGVGGDDDTLGFEPIPSPQEPSYALRDNAPAQDMVLVHEEQPDGRIALQWYVNAALYQKETAAAWFDALLGWATHLADDTRPVNTPLPALTVQENALLSRWQCGRVLPLSTQSLPALFERICAVHPDFPALATETTEIGYADVNARADDLAQALLDGGLTKGEPIGILTGRSCVLPETVLAVWKAGGCYVPLASDLPAERLAFIAEDCKLRRLIVLDGLCVPSALNERCMNQRGVVVLRPETLSSQGHASHPRPILNGDDPAYVIYTSGSTGVPKGVVLTHRGLNNLGVALSDALRIQAKERVLSMASPAFDSWISDLAMAWAAGGTVVPVLREEMNDIAGMRDKLLRLRVDVATMPPSYLHLFEKSDFPCLRLLMTVGEPPIFEDARHYAQRLCYVNGYGPTENTAAATVGIVVPDTERLDAGKPLANTSVHILSSRGVPAAPGARGMVWLGGMGLAQGYLNRPDLTNAAFVETPQGRLYRTGDYGRWTGDGNLQILGRSDSQVKLRGQRVELGEIESRLDTHPAVRRSVVVVGPSQNGTQTLWAFVCLKPDANAPSSQEWHDYLSAILPNYMVPSAVVAVASIPVTAVGKIDRAALLEQMRTASKPDGARETGTQPFTEHERRIADVWAEILGRAPSSREDDFFEMGGDSLLVIATVNRLRQEFDCKIGDLYAHSQLADFAAVCRPRSDRLQKRLASAIRHWRNYRDTLVSFEKERDASLAPQWDRYVERNRTYEQIDTTQRHYERVFLTGATGFLGCYLLRELMAKKDRHVTVLVRGTDNRAAKKRLADSVYYYFGSSGADMLDEPRLRVLAGDLRRGDLGLSSPDYARLEDEVSAVFHCAANVKHFGHYEDFSADNVEASKHLLKLAERSGKSPADFHFVSTLSTCGKPPESGFRLFTEYDPPNDVPDENYYIRSKQMAERLAILSRASLENVCIHRVGNVVFAADGGPMQKNIRQNAFFRHMASFARLGIVPRDAHMWLCHADTVARAIVLLAETRALTNTIHHIENIHREDLALRMAEVLAIRTGGFDDVLAQVSQAIGERENDVFLNEIIENFGLFSGFSPQAQARRQEIVSVRTHSLLAKFGLVWPCLPMAAWADMARLAAQTASAENIIP